MQTWYVDLDTTTPTPLTEDDLDTLLAALTEHGAALSGGRDHHLGVSMTVTADSAQEAMSVALNLLTDTGGVTLAGLDRVEVATEAAKHRQIEAPTIPDLVGYAEIAEIAGVSRQRAFELAGQTDFPIAVVHTANGPLRVRSAVERWATTRRRKPGRPRRTSPVAVPVETMAAKVGDES